MKKIVSILLLLLLLICLCACGEGTADNTTDNTQNQAAPGGTSVPPTTQCAHRYGETVTKEATCKEEGVKTFTCSVCGDTYTEPMEKLAHTFADATCTAAKTCTACGAAEGEAAGHTFAAATCTAAKTCSVCGAAEGEALGHSYTQGKCSRCGEAQPGYKALTEHGWKTAGLTPSGEELDVISLWFNGEESTIGAGFWAPLDQLDKEFQDEYLKYPDELFAFEGKKYYSMGFGDWRPMSHVEQGDTVVVSILEDEVIGTITMVRTAVDQYTITEITGRIIDGTVTSCLKVGSVFTAVEKSE